MQRRRSRFLRARQNKIEPVNFTTPAAKHRRNLHGGCAVGEAASFPYKLVALTPALYRPPMSKAFCTFFPNSIFILTLAMSTSAIADEGMWLFNAPPLKQLKEKYQFEPSPQWLEHLQKASVRFNSGGSGSFVSPNGLVITNHHVGADTLQKMGSVEHNYLRDGFYAKTQADEIKSTDLELNVLISIDDVTPRVTSALKPGMTSDQASNARNAAIAAIEKESKDKTKVARTIFTGTNVMTTCGWSSPRSSKWPSSAVTPTISS